MIADLLLFGGGLGAGIFGALLGLGGGILLVPFLSLGLNLPITTAVGTSLVSVIATSAGAAAHNVRTGRADVHLGLMLAAASVLGALATAVVAGLLPERLIAGLFAALALYTAGVLIRSELLARRARVDQADTHESPHANAVEVHPAPSEISPAYRTRRLGLALAGSLGAGVISALLGVGGGIVKVPLIHLVMRAPMHVAAATSNYIMGVTAAAGAYVYFFRGDVPPDVAGPVVLGVAAGSFLGARVAPLVRARWLAVLFVAVLLYVGVQMAARAAGIAT